MSPNRDDISHGLPATPNQESAPAPAKAILGAAAGASQRQVADRAQANDDFLSDFLGEDDLGANMAPAAVNAEALLEAMDAKEQAPATLSKGEDLDIRPLQASQTLNRVFPLAEPKEALVLAAMPHYDLGGKAGVRMGQLEMRHLISEAEASLKGPAQHLQEGSKRAIRETGEAVTLATHFNTDLVLDADATIRNLVAAGYIREIPLDKDERAKVRQLNEIIREDLSGDWKALDHGVNPVVAYELTDAGIEAGRSVRNWDGRSADAGMVRLPEGEPMPRAVATDAYALATVVMETRALAGTLKPGELGAFVRAEMASIEYNHAKGSDPEVTLGRLEGLVDLSRLAALNQIQNGTLGQQAPLRTTDMAEIAQRAQAVLDKLPQSVEEVSLEGVSNSAALDKYGASSDVLHLEGTRIACEAIEFRMSKGSQGIDLTSPDAWKGAVNFKAAQEEKAAPAKTWEDAMKDLKATGAASTPDNSMIMGDSLKIMKNWTRMIPGFKNASAEVMAFAQAAFGPKGQNMAQHLLARA